MIRYIILGLLGWIAFTILLYFACYTIGYGIQAGRIAATKERQRAK